MPRELIIKPAGIITQPNEIGEWPKGALRTCNDMLFRAPGRLRRARLKDSAVVSFATSYVNHLLYSTRYQALSLSRNTSTAWNVDWITQAYPSNTRTSVALTNVSGSDDFSTVGNLFAVTSRGRTIVNGERIDPIAFDYENPSSTDERTPRKAGLGQPDIDFGNQVVPGQAINHQTGVTYGVMLKRKFSDGYEIQSRPSLFVTTGNILVSPEPMNMQVYGYFSFTGAKAGDWLQLYRSQALPFTTEYVDPGATLYKVQEVQLSSTDISNGYYMFTDRALASDVGDPLGGLGEELYTNPFLGGLAATVNDPPPSCKFMATFRGRTWFANLRAMGKVTLSFRGPFGNYLSTDAERLHGLGQRSIIATRTNGNNQLSAISATHILGLAVGQSVSGTGIPASTTITAVGATTITMSNNATSSAAGGTYHTQDRIEILGSATSVTGLNASHQQFRKTTSRTYNPGIDGTAQMPGLELQLQLDRYVSTESFTVRATRGDLYDPVLPLMSQTALEFPNTTKPNAVMYSIAQRPEAVPPDNELQVGSGEIHAMIATRDALWFACTDGLHRLSGTIASQDGIPDIRVDPIDPTLFIAGPRAWCVLRDRIYMYTNRGLIEINGDEIRELTTGIIGDQLPGALWSEAATPFLVANESQDEVWIIGADDLNWIYSLRYGGFVNASQFVGAKCGVHFATTDAMAFAYGNASTALDTYREDSASVITAASLTFQPVFGDRPDSVKQWQMMTVIASLDTTIAYFNAILNDSTQSVNYAFAAATNGVDRRATVGIPRNAPAVAGAISAGLICGVVGEIEIEGLSLLYEVLTTQNDWARGPSLYANGIP